MQTILILGASSSIGAALSEQFSKGNRVILSGRNQSRLNAVSVRCTRAGAVAVKIVATDLSQSVHPIIAINAEWSVNLIVDAASAASLARDSSIAPDAMRDIFQADVLSHLDIYQQVARLNKKHPDVVFISTVLSIVKTPDREIYSSVKRMLEIYLEKMRLSAPDVKILVFRVGKTINPECDNGEAIALARSVKSSFLMNKERVLYGAAGVVLRTLYVIHPALVGSVIRLQRKIRRS